MNGRDAPEAHRAIADIVRFTIGVLGWIGVIS